MTENDSLTCEMTVLKSISAHHQISSSLIMVLWNATLGLFLSLMAMVGNGLVIFLILTKQRLHTTANWFVLSLAVADFGVGVVCLPTNFFCDVELLCANQRTYLLFMWFFLNASTTNLCVMTKDRYVAIAKPLLYMNVTRYGRVSASLALAWIVATIVSITDASLAMTTGSLSTPFRIFQILHMIQMMFFPCLLLVITTTHILYIVWKHSRQEAQIIAQLSFNGPENRFTFITPRRVRRESHSAKVLTIVVAAYVVCFANNIAVFSCMTLESCKPWIPLHYAAGLLLPANSALNPVAYSILKNDIKSELKRLLRFIR